MREIVAARNLMLELKDQTNLDLNGVGIVSKAWEDNIGTQNLANSIGPLLLVRTKHIGIKNHWFRSKIELNKIEINIIGTKYQREGLITKELTWMGFGIKRKLIMGW